MEMVCFLRRYARRMRVRSGALIISEGGLGASIFFLISGRAQVLKITGCHEEALQELLPGCFFGCTSLSGDKGYPASVAAAKDCELYELKRCLLYTSDAADDLLCVDLGGLRIIKKKTKYITALTLPCSTCTHQSM